jgi:hypothetical protein
VKGISTQTAILVAGALVAGGVALGLAVGLRGHASKASETNVSHEVTARTDAPPAPASPTQDIAPSAPPAAKGTRARGNAALGSGELETPSFAATDARTRAVGADASRALSAQLPALRARCWEPARARAPEPASVTLVLNYTFGADGKQLARGVSDVPGASRPDVTRCVASHVSTIEVPPPGDRTYVEVPITLP